MANVPKSNTGPFGIPPGGPWFVYATTGTIQRQSNPALAVALANAGWVGFASKQDAENFAHNNVISKGKQTVKDANPVKPITDVLHFLTSPDAWVRGGEILAGGILLIAGIMAILKVPDKAAKVGKVAALL
jgi:hypothetical protein